MLAVEIDRLREAARFAGNKADAIQAELTRLDNTIGRELLVDGWQGTAASAYDESWLEWKHGCETVISALRESSASLASAANEFERQDDANRDAITSVSSLIL